MTTIARRVRSIPVRTATETWALIVDMLTAADDTIRKELVQIGNVASMLISEEHTAPNPIILTGCGPQVRLYTLHGSAAIDGTNVNEQSLTITAADTWQLSLPASGEDFDLALAALSGVTKVDVYDPSAGSPSTTQTNSDTDAPRRIAVDLSALEN